MSSCALWDRHLLFFERIIFEIIMEHLEYGLVHDSKGLAWLWFGVCASKKKKRQKKEKNKCIYVCIQCHPSLRLLYWVSCLWKFVCELSGGFIFLCLSRYVSYVWETNDLFLGISNYCHLHHYIHWWFDHSPWLDLSGLVLILFPSIYLFLSWYFIRLTYIVLCSYQFTFRVRYFPHIILIHPISSSIFFISSLSSLIYSSCIFSSSLIYSY